jgi:hypothetical protein
VIETCGTCGDPVQYEDEETMPPRDNDDQAICDTCYAAADAQVSALVDASFRLRLRACQHHARAWAMEFGEFGSRSKALQRMRYADMAADRLKVRADEIRERMSL